MDSNCKNIKIGDTSPKRDFNFVKDTVNAFIQIAVNHAQGFYSEPFSEGQPVLIFVIMEGIDCLEQVKVIK